MANDLDQLFQSAADQYGLPVGFIKAIAQQETGTNPNSRDSYQGAQGLMQMLPQTAAAMGAQDPRDPAQAIPAAARYLREGLDATGSLSGAAAYYHGGPDRKQWGPKTQNYVQSVGSIFSKMPQPQGVEPRTVSVEEALGDTGKAAPAMASDDFDKRWGIGATDSAAPTQSSTDDFDKRWGIKPDAETAAAPGSTGDLQGTALAAGLVNGVPIAGPYILSGLEKTGAAANAVLNNSRYSDELAAIQKRAADAEALHGAASTAGNIAGAVAGYTAGGIPALGARALGMTGASLAGRAALGGTSNAIIGGVDAAARGEDAATGAIWGGAGGVAGPYAGKVVGRILESAGDGIRSILPTSVPGVSRPAANALNKLIVADDPAAVRAALVQHGNLAMLADAGPALNQITGGLAAAPNEAQGIVRGALKVRQDNAINRLTGDINGALGPAPIPSLVEAGLAASREQLGPEYQRVMAGASAVDTTSLANALDASTANLRGPAQQAVQRVRSYLNIPGTDHLDPNPQALLATRQAIDGMMAGEQNPQVIRHLTMARQQVDGELAQAVPGIKDVDAKFAELSRQSEGLQQGGALLNSGKTAIHPADLAESFPQSAVPQGAMVGPSGVPLRTQQGARAEIDRLVGTKANDLTALKTMLQGEGGWNTNKLTTVFGPEPTNRLLGAVQREAQFADTAQTVTRNSESVRRNEANKFLKDAEPGSLNLSGATVTGLGLQAAKKWIADPLVRTIMESSSAPMQAEMARVLTMQGASRDQVLSRLIALHAREQGVSAIGEAAGRIGRGATNRLLGAAGATSQR